MTQNFAYIFKFFPNMAQSETNATTQQILRFLFEQRVFAWRQNSLGIFDRSSGSYRASGKSGVADILACVPPRGRLLAIEIKTGKDRLRPEQQGFLASIKATGGFCMVVHSFEDFTSQWKSAIIEP